MPRDVEDMTGPSKFRHLALATLSVAAGLPGQQGPSPFHGEWAFDLPGGTPAWLRVHDVEGTAAGELLWSVGSARPVQQLEIADGKLRFHRARQWKPGADLSEVWVLSGSFEGLIDEQGRLQLSTTHFPKGKPTDHRPLKITGRKLPPLPSKPDLAKVRFGPAESLFNGRNLDGWKLSDPTKKNGWRAENGVLVNETPKTDFGGYGEYGNLVTVKRFEDFRLRLEYNVPVKGNAGVYLRGMYEAQVVDRDSRMQGISGPGAIFGRIEPSENAANPGGEWNEYVITLVDRHVTIVLNGKKVIDNQPVIGCTGGGLSADCTKPGPLFLQGDHTSVRYRNLMLEPVAQAD